MANVRWLGGAAAVKQVTTVTIADTWATNDTVTLTVGNKALIVTIGAAFGVNDVAAALNAAINAADKTTGLIGSESRNVGGQEIPEFTDFSSTVLGAVVTITGNDAGKPFTISATESTAGTGTATGATATAATGPNHADNAANYQGGALPVNNDVLYFDTGDVDCLYGLGYFRTATVALTVNFSNDWTGQLGLPPVNVDGGYAEYRQRFFYFYGASSKTTTLSPGVLGNTAGGTLYLDYQGCVPAINLNAARNADMSEPSVVIAGGAATVINLVTIKAGNVSIEPDDANTGSNEINLGAVVLGTVGGNDNDLTVTIGGNAVWDTTATLTINSGLIYSPKSPVSNASEIKGGVLRLRGSSIASSFGDFNVYNGGTLMPIYGGSCDVVNIFAGGTLDAREAQFAFTSSNGCTAHPGSSIYDPAGDFLFCAATALLTLPGGKLSDITHDLPAGRIVDMTALA